MTKTRSVVRWTAAFICTAGVAIPAAFSATAAAPSPDASEDAYKCVVLGINEKCARKSESTSEGVQAFVQLGPRAAGAVKEGVPRDEAIAGARKAGEVPRLRIVRVLPLESESITQREKREQSDPRLAGHEQTLAVVDEP